MSIRHDEIEIKTDQPFANCKLDRQKYAVALTNIVHSYPRGFVLAINNKWGTGKTTFVKMWEQYLKNYGHQTVYFNAWENDFENNPLTALMGELKTLTKTSTEPAFQSALEKAAVLTKNIAPIIIQAVVNRYIDTDEIRDAITGVANGVTDIFEKDVNEYSEKKKSISDFRLSLSEFISKTNEGKPLIFIIDELDRCRPNYAVSILEQIKHFFSTPDIVFILSIDKTQLGNAVRGVYGSENIDADEYLRRFIDIEYTIPEPDGDKFFKYLYDYFEFDNFFQSEDRKKFTESYSDKENFLNVCKLIFTDTTISLRQQERIFSLARLSLRSFNHITYVVPHLFIFLVFLKIVENRFYSDLKNGMLSIDEVQDNFVKVFKTAKLQDSKRELMWLESYIIYFYDKYTNPNFITNKLFNNNAGSDQAKILIKSKIDKDANDEFQNLIMSIHGSQLRNLKLDLYFNRIDLLETIKV